MGSTDPTIPADLILAAWLAELERICTNLIAEAECPEVDDASGRWQWVMDRPNGLHRERVDDFETFRLLTIPENQYAADVLNAGLHRVMPTALRIIREHVAKIERLQAIIADLTSAVLSYNPSEAIRDTNLVVVAQQAAVAAKGGNDGMSQL